MKRNVESILTISNIKQSGDNLDKKRKTRRFFSTHILKIKEGVTKLKRQIDMKSNTNKS